MVDPHSQTHHPATLQLETESAKVSRPVEEPCSGGDSADLESTHMVAQKVSTALSREHCTYRTSRRLPNLARVDNCQREMQSVQAHIRKLVRAGASKAGTF